MSISSAKIRVFIADDHPVVRHGLTAIINCQDDLEIAGEAENTCDLLRGINETRPEVLLLDLELDPNCSDGSASLATVRKNFPHLRTIIYTAHEDPQRAIEVIELGVDGFVLKQADPNELLLAIRVVRRGGNFLQAEVASTLMSHMRRGNVQRDPDRQSAISAREMQVLNLMAKGQSNQKIASALIISERTVKFHVSSILNKLDVENRTAAVLKASREGILSTQHAQ